MAYEYKELIAHGSNYYSSGKRALSGIKYIVIHYTGNDGDTDEANAKYFKTANRKASAHYFIDDNSITCSVKDEYTAWSVGGGLKDQGSPYKDKGAKYYKIVTNSNSLSFELCDTTKDGKNNLSKATRDNAIKFIALKMKQYNIDINHVVRHFDVTGKLCPYYFVVDENDWNVFKTELSKELSKLGVKNKPISKPIVASPTLRRKAIGKEVGNLQRDLNYVLPSNLAIDENFGNKTEEALKKFQDKYNLVVDGVYGQKSYTKMKLLI